MDLLEKNNCAGMVHIALLDINIGSEYLAISRAHSHDTLINFNQASFSLDRQGHAYREIFIRSQNTCDKMSIDFEQNMNKGIHMHPSRTISSISPHITSIDSGTGNGWNSGVG